MALQKALEVWYYGNIDEPSGRVCVLAYVKFPLVNVIGTLMWSITLWIYVCAFFQRLDGLAISDCITVYSTSCLLHVYTRVYRRTECRFRGAFNQLLLARATATVSAERNYCENVSQRRMGSLPLERKWDRYRSFWSGTHNGATVVTPNSG